MENYGLVVLKVQLLSIAVVLLLSEYVETYIDKSPCMTSSFIGDRWIGELLVGHPERFHNMFRMSKRIFIDLLSELETYHGFHGSSRTSPREVLGITLYILAHNESMRATCERFQHSTETVCRYFDHSLKSLVSLARKIVVPIDPQFSSTPKEIRHDPRYMPHFKDCIGAIDGTHVHARVPNREKAAYIGRSGSASQNVMAVCDFNMCFTFVMAGWEGTAHDSRIFQFATRNPKYLFPLPPLGKYYVVDAAYPMIQGFIKPFPATRYHIPDFQRSSNPPQGRHEMFNKRHSSLRGVIERTFGVWKKKWSILRDMPSYPFKKQVKIVIGTVALHNFIRRHPSRDDVEFDSMDEDDFLNETSEEDLMDVNNEDNILTTQEEEGSSAMKLLRDQITDSICNM